VIESTSKFRICKKLHKIGLKFIIFWQCDDDDMMMIAIFENIIVLLDCVVSELNGKCELFLLLACLLSLSLSRLV
jgi:hypothetical protein